jgi:hypothetical protein
MLLLTSTVMQKQDMVNAPGHTVKVPLFMGTNIRDTTNNR